ncbi:hypothetical protein ID866_7279 [Astraeus odoratus]|nr:hypothetical protein ID866_7279 [Astraeus odoratus]
MNAASTTPAVSTVFGQWHRVSQTAADIDVDLEAQVITGARVSCVLPAFPEPARSAAAPTRTPTPTQSRGQSGNNLDNEEDTTTDPVDDFFGVTRPRATRESRHDSYPSVSRVSAVLDGDAPPPYGVDAGELPAYTVAPTEPATLAMYLFKFGFLFPPFWILGAIILVSPLNAPADFEPEKSDAERREVVQLMRTTELRWARRCAWALLVLLVVLGTVAGVVAAVMKSQW